MMNDMLNTLEDTDCEKILKFLVKRAYGNDADVRNDVHSMYIYVKHEKYFMIGYDKNCTAVESIGCKDDIFSWKKILTQIMDFLHTNGGSFISYHSYEKHMIDASTSIEEVLISIELKDKNLE